MTPSTGDLLSFDRDRVDYRAGIVGLLVLSVIAVAIAIWGPVALAAVIGALLLLASSPPRTARSWAVSVAPLAVGGSLLTFVAVAVGARPLPAAILVGLVGIAVTLLADRSEKAGVRGLIGTIWIILALTLGETKSDATPYALAFAAGAIVGAAAAWLKARSASDKHTDELDPEDVPGTTSQTTFAVLRGLGLAVATYIGFTYFPDHPAWIAITVVIVVRPPTRHAVIVGLQRSLGTGLGVIVAVIVANVIGENTLALVILFLAAAFLAIAFREVNYALFASFVTALVVYSQRILGADASDSGVDRLIETVAGVAIAFVVLGLTQALERRHHVEV